jgi:octaprenyl-diphosphate synthase
MQNLDFMSMFIADPRPVDCPDAAVSTDGSKATWQHLIQPVESFMDSVSRRLAAQVDSFDPALRGYAEYALNGHGKHLRPALVALSADASGTVGEDHVVAAVVIEMVHLATLVHDDVMDEAAIRRARPTLAAKWGNETAVLFGDCLFAEALRLAASFPTPEVCRAVSSATNTVCAGEILQTRNRGNFELSLEDYLKVIDMKTAELFALSCDLAAHLTQASEAHRAALKQFGRSFGVAYQIFDDCQDVFGSEAEAGKSLGTDLAKGKLTLPLINLRRHVSNGDLIRLEELFRQGEVSNLRDVRGLLNRHGILNECEAVICERLQEARRALAILSPNDGVERLRGCTHFLERQLESFRRD